MKTSQKTAKTGVIIILVLIIIGLIYFSQNSKTTGVSNDKPISFNFPTLLSTKYIQTVNNSDISWPPKVSTSTQFYCMTNASIILAVDGKMGKTPSGVSFCKTVIPEGAAGSTYTTYVYSFIGSKDVTRLTFTLRQPQCMNYDEPKQTECKNEESGFDVDAMVVGAMR